MYRETLCRKGVERTCQTSVLVGWTCADDPDVEFIGLMMLHHNKESTNYKRMQDVYCAIPSLNTWKGRFFTSLFFTRVHGNRAKRKSEANKILLLL